VFKVVFQKRFEIRIAINDALFPVSKAGGQGPFFRLHEDQGSLSTRIPDPAVAIASPGAVDNDARSTQNRPVVPFGQAGRNPNSSAISQSSQPDKPGKGRAIGGPIERLAAGVQDVQIACWDPLRNHPLLRNRPRNCLDQSNDRATDAQNKLLESIPCRRAQALKKIVKVRFSKKKLG